MTPEATDFRVGAIAPVECLKAGWANIKDQYWLFLGMTLLTMLIGGAVPIVLIGPMMCGLYMCLLAKMRGEPVEFGLLFKGFDYFVPGLVAAAIQTVPGFVFGLAAGLISAIFSIAASARERYPRSEGPPAIFWLVLAVLVVFAIIVGLLIQVLFLFAYPLIVDRKLSGWEAIKTSYRAALKNFGGLVGLVLLNAGVGIVGVLCCYFGVFFVLPVTFAAQAAAYRRVFPDIGPSFPTPPPPPGSWAA
jgi:hypothetical protein